MLSIPIVSIALRFCPPRLGWRLQPVVLCCVVFFRVESCRAGPSFEVVVDMTGRRRERKGVR